MSFDAIHMRAATSWTSGRWKGIDQTVRWLPLIVQIFSCSVWVGRPPPGAALMNLRYRDERSLGSGTVSKQQEQQTPPATPPRAPGVLVGNRSLERKR